MNTLKIKEPVNFRKNIVAKLNVILNDDKKSINMEKAIYNFTFKEGKIQKIINKWDNKQFVTLYISKLWTIFNNLKNPTILKQLNDGHYIFPDSYSDLGKIWFDINMKKLTKELFRFWLPSDPRWKTTKIKNPYKRWYKI